MRKFKFGKLVRNKIADNIIEDGGIVQARVLSEKEFLEQLKDKLIEEAQELKSANNDELVSELADVIEITEAILRLKGISNEELDKIRSRKLEKAGGFDKRIFIEFAEVPDDSKWIDYYLSQPDRYPEIKEKK